MEILLLLGALLLVLVCVEGLRPSKEQRAPRQHSNNENNNSEGVRPVSNDRTYEGLETMVDVVNQAMEEVGLPKIDIDSAQSVFASMPRHLREQMDAHLGPNFKDAVAGFLNMHLETIGKAEEFQSRTLLLQLQEALQMYQADVTGRFAVRRLEKALINVNDMTDVAAKYGEENAEEFGRALRRAVLKAEAMQYLTSVMQISAPEVEHAVNEALPLIEEVHPELPAQVDRSESNRADGPVNGDYEEIRGNGHRAKGREKR